MDTSIRPDLADAHRVSRTALASGGTRWSARERRALADTAMRAMWVSEPLAPWATNESVAEFVPRSLHDDAPLSAHRAVARMARHASTIDRSWYENVSTELGELEYVELVEIVCLSAAVSSLNHSLGGSPIELPEPEVTNASGTASPDLANATLNWVPVAAPADASAAVVQALTAVPQSHANLWRLADAQYIPNEEMVDPKWTRGTLSRVEMELVATHVSRGRECHY